MATVEGQIVNLDGSTRQQKSSTQLSIQRPVVWITILLFIAGFIFLAEAVSLTQAVLYLVAGVLGMGLYHARYGFTTSYRQFLVSGRGAGIRAQMILFLIANVIFLPFLLSGHAFGHTVAGYVFPVGISVLAGSILFGMGMQLGDACASGTLYHTGGGDVRGIVTLVGFIVGSVLGTINFTWWQSTPNFGPISFLKTFGTAGGFLFNLLLLAVVFTITLIVEKSRNGNVESLRLKEPVSASNILRGPWSWITGSIVLAIGALLVLILSGKPWGVTAAFATWGAKVAQSIGVPVTNWGYWQIPGHAAQLQGNILHDVTTILNIGIIFGALLAAGLAGRFPQKYFRAFPVRMIVGVFIGGILMGYGARIAFGCNIGAYFAGIASFSLHGWEWMVGGMIGSAVGIAIRPLVGLANR